MDKNNNNLILHNEEKNINNDNVEKVESNTTLEKPKVKKLTKPHYVYVTNLGFINVKKS